LESTSGERRGEQEECRPCGSSLDIQPVFWKEEQGVESHSEIIMFAATAGFKKQGLPEGWGWGCAVGG